MYCLVVTDDYSRFTWVFFLASKDETSVIFKTFITGIENLVDHKVKVIRCDNRAEYNELPSDPEIPALEDINFSSDHKDDDEMADMNNLDTTIQIDRLERSLLIQGFPNDIYSLFDSNKTAKDLWDALERHMLGFEYGEQDRKVAVLNLFPPLDNPELTFQRRSRADPTLLNDFEMAAEGIGDLPVPDLRTIEELCQPSLNGRGGPIAPIAIQATNFGLKNDMIQQSIKVNGVTNDALRLYLFPHYLTYHATAWFDRGTFMKRRPEECYDLIENMTAHHNDWDTSTQQSESSSSITSSSDTEITALKAEMAKINKNLMRVLQVNQQVKAVTPNCETCGGPHSFNDCPATVGNSQNVYAAGAYQGNTITNPKEELKGITTRIGAAYQGATTPTTSSSLPPVVECKTEATKDTVHPTNNGKTKDVQPPDLNFNISFADALILMPKFGPSIKTLLTNKDKLYFDADPRVPLILGRSFLKTGRDLIDVFEGELTLRVGKEAITFNLDQTSRYSANYNDMTANRNDVIDMACEEYSQEVLCFSDVIASGNPTPYYDPIVSTTSPTLTPFGNSDFLLEEVDAFLALEDDPTSSKVD
nr:reverse transcriptase domain-containing protein [Tanacetum cinerariifolium]